MQRHAQRSKYYYKGFVFLLKFEQILFDVNDIFLDIIKYSQPIYDEKRDRTYYITGMTMQLYTFFS